MKLINHTLHSIIDSAIHDAEKLFSPTSRMMVEISKKDDFKYNSGMGHEIYSHLINYNKPISVFTYKPKWFLSRAIGYSDKYGIHINVYKLPKLSHVDLVGNLAHEACHQAGFNHGTGLTSNYKTTEKCLYSVPYFVSTYVKRFL